MPPPAIRGWSSLGGSAAQGESVKNAVTAQSLKKTRAQLFIGSRACYARWATVRDNTDDKAIAEPRTGIKIGRAPKNGREEKKTARPFDRAVSARVGSSDPGC